MQVLDFHSLNSVGVKLFFRHWQVTNAQAVVCLVHGLGEHIGRYDHVAKFFSTKNIGTIGFDQQGHGHTAGKRGHVQHWESMLDDVGLLLKTAKENYPGLPIFLYGHSMGGNVVLNYVLRKKPSLNGLIVSAPWIRLPIPPSPFLVFFGKIMNHIVPQFDQPNGLDINEISRDKKIVEAYKNDPLVHDRISVRAGTSLLAGARWLDNFSGPMPCPTLLMHGTGDSLTSPLGTAEFSQRTSGEVTLKPWNGLKHEIHNEPEMAEVFKFLVDWMERFM